MPAAVAIPALIGGAASLGGAAIASKSAKSAAKTQSESADKALALNRDIYNQQRAMLNPYVQMGTSSLGRLMDAYWGNKPYGMTAAPSPAMGPGPSPGMPMLGAAMGPGPAVGNVRMLPPRSGNPQPMLGSALPPAMGPLPQPGISGVAWR